MPDADLLTKMKKMYTESLSAMNAELSALIAFTEDFRGPDSYERLRKAQTLIREEIEAK